VGFDTSQRRIRAEFATGVADHGEPAEGEPITGALGEEPPAGPRDRAPGGRSSGEDPLKLKAFCSFS